MSQIGNSLRLAVTAAIAASVTAHETPKGQGPNSPEALLKGYHVAFWTMLTSVDCVAVSPSEDSENGAQWVAKTNDFNMRSRNIALRM